MSIQKSLIVVCGPTAVGKTAMAIELASMLGTEILSADSRQFFRELIIGAAMPSAEELSAVPHHFIGHLSIQDPYNVSAFEQEALSRIEKLHERHNTLLLVGGSGLYIDAVCNGIDVLPDPDPNLRLSLKALMAAEGITALQEKLLMLDPEYYKVVDLKNPTRLIRALEVCITSGQTYTSLRIRKQNPRPFRIIKIGLDLPKAELMERIRQRTLAMLECGLEEECRSLLPYRQLNALNTVGYKEMFSYLDGAITLEEATEKIIVNTWRYAKRQLTWFRRDPEIKWFSKSPASEIMNEIQPFINHP